MSLRQKQLHPFLRTIAAVTLLFWISALALCAVHCSLGVGHSESDGGSCHGSAAAQSNHDDHDSPSPAQHDSSEATCLTLKSALSNGNALTYVHPAFPVFYTLAPLAFALDSTVIKPTALAFRQARPREWVFTPEVCLGPAFRSLAPPSSSLV